MNKMQTRPTSHEKTAQTSQHHDRLANSEKSQSKPVKNHRPFDINCGVTVLAYALVPFIPVAGILSLTHLIPSTMMLSPVLNVSIWFLISWTIVSILEQRIHAVLMHRRTIPRFEKTFIAHAVTHHKHYSASFTDEPVPVDEDTDIRLTVLKAPIKTFPVVAAIGLFSLQGAMIFVGAVLTHHLVWNAIHLEMHKPEGRFFSNWAWYQYCVRYHLEHHRHPDKNFNVVIPIGDLLFGTYRRPGS